MRSTSLFAVACVSSVLVTVFWSGATATAAPIVGPYTILNDDFDDNWLDTATWQVVLAGVPGTPSVTEQNQRMEIVGRGHLATTRQLEPKLAGGLEITGRWQFVSSDDMIQILTRSNATPGGTWGETNQGIEFFAYGASDTMTIQGKGIGVSGAVAVPLQIDGGDVFDFVIRDDGANLTFTLTEVGGQGATGTVTATATTAVGTNYVVFHNRESGRVSYLDDAKVRSIVPLEPDRAHPLLVADDFNDNVLDTGKWQVNTFDGSATEQNDRMELLGRTHLVTASEFDPLDTGGLRVAGIWQFVSSDDFLQILTRSDGTPSGTYGETQNGIEFVASATSDNMTITGRGATVTGASPESLTIGAGSTFMFEILDDGTNLTFTMTEIGGLGQVATVTATSLTDMTTDYIVFHGREGNRTSYLDNVYISSLAVPEPSALVLLCLGGPVLLCSRRRRGRVPK